MSAVRDEVINKEYERILAAVAGGRLYGEYVLNPKELVVAAYYLGRMEALPEPTVWDQLEISDLE